MTDFEAISALLERYFTFLHEADVDAIDEVFLSECDLICPMADGTLVHMTRDAYAEAVAGRESPKSQGYPRHGVIQMIDQSGPMTALAKVDCAVQPRYFRDYLILVKRHGDWKIAAKVFCVTKTGD